MPNFGNYFMPVGLWVNECNAKVGRGKKNEKATKYVNEILVTSLFGMKIWAKVFVKGLENAFKFYL